MDDQPISAESSADTHLNPFDSDATLPAFIGREQALSRLHQHLTDPANTHATLYLGRWHIGKTALLQHFDQFFDDTFISVYIPLKNVEFRDDTRWILDLMQAIQYYVKSRGYHPTISLNDATSESNNLREWFKGVFLEEVYRVIRPQRRIALLLDDTQVLIQAMQDKTLPDDTFAYLHSLMGSQFGIALTLPVDHEDLISQLAPLSRLTDVQRLHNLSQTDVITLLNQTLPNIDAEACNHIHDLIGGDPYLLNRFGYHTYTHWQNTTEMITAEDVTTIRTKVQVTEHDYMLTIWQSFSHNERLVMTALSDLFHENPIRALTPRLIETWLIDTDYPTDIMTVNATIRSLEYRELLSSQEGRISFNGMMMRDWMIQHASISPTKQTNINADAEGLPRQLWVILGIIVLIAVIILFAISQSDSGGGDGSDTPLPTVTLIPQNTP